ncbi:hypothetical protein [Neisseria dumasiana]|uniref:Enoyl-CoA hydratase n=1 Tax=Neisseria dumasiana TaxID=1931275 RepID=A0A1X3DKE6_9NEIS|nr:hypothetical protein [Neisseria dumasiana]OSI24638.1 hypothetical protein BV912_01940 [Neisseria dumasiana]
MTQVYLALYKGYSSEKGVKAWVGRLKEWLVRKMTRGIYSHCEIAVKRSDGLFCCRSASLRDGGVREKVMPLPSEKWDLIPLKAAVADGAVNLMERTARGKYDYLGALGTVSIKGGDKNKWFCSEWCGEALGIAEPWRFSPNDLAVICAVGKVGF